MLGMGHISDKRCRDTFHRHFSRSLSTCLRLPTLGSTADRNTCYSGPRTLVIGYLGSLEAAGYVLRNPHLLAMDTAENFLSPLSKGYACHNMSTCDTTECGLDAFTENGFWFSGFF